MATKQEMNKWLGISEAMLRLHLPKEAGEEIFGYGMPPNTFANLVETESDRVDNSLVEMALASDKEGIDVILNKLDKDTAIALFSRWTHHMEMWSQSVDPDHWVPENPNQIWQAVLLSMVQSAALKVDAAQNVFGE